MASTQLVGVDIGSSSIRAVEVTGVGSKRPSVARFFSLPLPEGAVKNGEVIEVNRDGTPASANIQLTHAQRPVYPIGQHTR